MTDTPRDMEGALAYARAQSAQCDPPAQYGNDWHNLCQAFCHEAYGLHTGGFGSAYAQWLGLDAEDRHATSDLSKAPLGALLFTKGVDVYGHIYIAARPFKNGTPAAWSTDLKRYGQVDKVARTAPVTAWGHRILGWGTSINGYSLDLTHGAPPKPKQDKPYQRIERAITNLGHALDTARKHKDAADVKLLEAEIARLKRMHSSMRHA